MSNWRRGVAFASASLLLAACSDPPAAIPVADDNARARHLYVWAGDKDKTDSDFLIVLDADSESAQYGEVLATLPVGASDTMPHHVEYEFPSDGRLFISGWTAGQTSLVDLRDPLNPKLAAQLTDMGPLSYPHSYARLDNGNLLVTLQGHDGKYGAPGGLAELTPDGRVLRTASAVSPDTPDELVWPYSVAIVPGADRAVVSLAEMGWPGRDYKATNQVQVWSPSDMKLLATLNLPPSGVGEHHIDPAEPRVLATGAVYVSTFTCGLYRIDGVTGETPTARFAHAFPGGTEIHDMCSVPVVIGDYWIQPVPAVNGLIALDMSDPDKPVEVSRLSFDAHFHMPHWVAADRASNRLVITGNDMSWALIALIDPDTGALSLDEKLPDGVDFDRTSWPHGETGPAVVHGALFGP